MIKILKNNDELLDVIKNNNNLVVDFYANWCQPCQMQGPILENVAKKSAFYFCKIDINNLNSAFLQQLNIVSIPTIIIFKKGKETNRFIGLTNEKTLLDVLKK